MMKLIKDAIFSMRNIILFNSINTVVEQTIKNNRKNVINSATKIKYKKHESRNY
jgi:hypothetical protein